MQEIVLTEEMRESAKKLIDIPITYKKLIETFGLSLLNGSSKVSQIKELQRIFNIETQRKPTRYIIKEIYETKKTRYGSGLILTNKQDFLDLCERRHLTPVGEVPEFFRGTDKIAYTCDFHPDNILYSTLRNLKHTIGCPLCKYPMSRFEVMIFLGLEYLGAIHRPKLNGVEYDIYIPNRNILIEVDGLLYHTNDESNGRAERKYDNAQKLSCALYKVIEQEPKSEIYREENKIYVVPYLTATLKEKEQIIKLLEETFSYKDAEGLWDKATDYMREWKNKHQEQEHDKKIYQYDTDGNLINVFGSFKEIQDAIKSGEAFGFNWAIT